MDSPSLYAEHRKCPEIGTHPADYIHTAQMPTDIDIILINSFPNKKQNTKLFQTADTARYAYNWTLVLHMDNFKQTGKYLSDGECRKLFTFHKQENQWLYNVSIGVESKLNIQQNNNDGIGIDVGVKDLAIDSNNNKIFNINKTQTVKKLKKKQRRLQRSISGKYNMNREGDNYCKTSSIIKSEKQLLKLNQRLTDIRHNHVHQATNEILKAKPSYIWVVF